MDLLFAKILIANRGEIALRIMRACRDLGIPTIAIYGEGEQDAIHVRYAGEAYRLRSEAVTPYLDVDAVLQIAAEAGARAIHPGYGFLAENAEFASRCAAAGYVFIGPPADVIAEMGDKIRAREIARAVGVPLVPGSEGAVDPESVAALADEIGYPVALKAAAGGGGRGFRVAQRPSELDDALSGASGEGDRYFGDGRVFVERYLEHPRHVEIQVLADQRGNTVALGERDCSIQRRHQKLIEETPSPALDQKMREQMESAAVKLARAVGYVNAGTVEFMLQGEEFYFLEMNTRIQVEHPVTEMVTGVDLVAEQIRIAAGKEIDSGLGDARFGHAIECRINAEDVSAGFQPVSGTITGCALPAGPGVRLDGVIETGAEVSPRYDSMLGKLVVWGRDRDQAISRMQRALRELSISGLAVTTQFHRGVMAHPEFQGGAYDTRFLERNPEILDSAAPSEAANAPGRLSDEPKAEQIQLEVNGRRFDIRVYRSSECEAGRRPPRLDKQRKATAIALDGSETIVSPIQGTVLSVAIESGDTIKAGDVICVVEAMKMENEISAGRDGVVAQLNVSAGETIESGAVIAVIESGVDSGTES